MVDCISRWVDGWVGGADLRRGAVDGDLAHDEAVFRLLFLLLLLSASGGPAAPIHGPLAPRRLEQKTQLP